MLKTEMRNPKSTHIDKASTLEMMRIMQEENKNAIFSLDAEIERISEAVDIVAEAIGKGGRVFYVGAGTSGRLGICDAAECPPTFGVPSDMFIGIMAGGEKAIINASENKEDSGESSIRALQEKNLCTQDVVIGISAAGGASFVLEALRYAKSLGCRTIGITSNKGSALDLLADLSICPDTGAEVITGSTRMKAGTAQKVILNMISTGAMIRNGYVYENLMINLKPTNVKLKKRVVGIVMEILRCNEEKAVVCLNAAEWDIKRAIAFAEGGEGK